MKVQGQVCWVSGAAQGIGLELSARLVAQGGLVVMVDVCPQERGEALAEELNATGPGKAAFVRADMTRADQVEASLGKAKELFGEVATIVAPNAGIAVNDNDSRWQMMLELNVVGVITATRVAADLMKQAGKPGVVVSTASMAGLMPVPTTPIYAASKWAVVGYTLSLARLVKSHGVRVNCVCPSLVDTAGVGGFFTAEWGKEKSKAYQAMANNKLESATVVNAHMRIIEDDSLVASAVGVMPGKIFVHDPQTMRVLGQAKTAPAFASL